MTRRASERRRVDRRTAVLGGLLGALFCVAGAATAQAPPPPVPAAPAVDPPAAGADLAAGEPLVLGHRFTFRSAILGEERPVLVRVPASYPRFLSQRYPVLVLLDAETHFHHGTALADYLAFQRLAPEMIVVGIPNADRVRDFTPVAVDDAGGGGGRFAAFLRDELVPWLDANFRTAPFRILFGHSLTGNFALWSLAETPDLFAGVVAASPWVIWNEGWIVGDTERRWLEDAPGGRFVYLTAGDEPELLPTLDRYRALAAARSPDRLAWEYRRMPGHDHGTLVPDTLWQGLSWIFDGWRLDDRLADFPALERHYRQLSERLGFDVAPPEATVNLHGYRNLLAGRVEPALALFRANVEAYPESANVHDSLGEALEAAGRLGEAVASYRRAVAISRTTGDPLAEAFVEHLEAAEAELARGGS